MHFLGLANCIWHGLCNLCNETLAWAVSLQNHVFTSPRLFPVLCHQCTCIQGSLFSHFSRLPNDLRTTSERHQDISQNDQLIAHKNPETADHSSHVRCVPSHWPDSNLFHRWVNFPSNTVKLFCHVAKWPRHGIVKKMLFPKKETAERNFLYGYDVAESSSDVDATSSSSNSSESSAET